MKQIKVTLTNEAVCSAYPHSLVYILYSYHTHNVTTPQHIHIHVVAHILYKIILFAGLLCRSEKDMMSVQVVLNDISKKHHNDAMSTRCRDNPIHNVSAAQKERLTTHAKELFLSANSGDESDMEIRCFNGPISGNQSLEDDSLPFCSSAIDSHSQYTSNYAVTISVIGNKYHQIYIYSL